MLEYVYIVKCPNCEDEHFYFFNDAKEFALSSMSRKPIITQVEVNRNDFGECTDSADLGTIWSWEDMMKTDDEPATSVFTKDDLKRTDYDPEFDVLDNSLDYIPDNFRKSKTLVTEEEQRLAVNKKGDYIVQASSGKGYTVFNKNNVCIGGFDGDDDEEAIRRFNLGDIDEAFERKPVPADMSIDALVEEMEENEDTVECKWCDELFDKSECRYEVDMGWLCDRCQAAILSRGEPLTFREGPLDEAIDPREMVELEYPSLTVTLYGEKRDVDDWDEFEHSDSHVYLVPKVEVAEVIWNDCITEEDVADVEGGLEALEDDTVWEQFLDTHFEALFEKYQKEILEYFKEEATEDFRERSQEEYQMNKWSDQADRAYDEWRDERYFGESANNSSMLEELEEPDSYRKRLNMCPECGDNSFDAETGICINCGFN